MDCNCNLRNVQDRLAKFLSLSEYFGRPGLTLGDLIDTGHISMEELRLHCHLPTKVGTRKHSVYTHVPKDRNCEVCKRTKITRAPCRKRTGEAVRRAKKFGDLITADHKVLNEGGESPNNHRDAVVVQDLVPQGFNLIRVKRNLLRRRKGVHEDERYS